FMGNAPMILRTPLTAIQDCLETLQEQFPDQHPGLGLTVVKHVLLRHNAQLEIDSRPGESSAFICHFPIDHDKSNNSNNSRRRRKHLRG
ncbi:MAG: hypothetical protein V7677_19015, partial [Motiliproteus sp.]